MPAIQSKLDPASEAFLGNRKRMLELVSVLRDLETRTRTKSEEAKPLFDKRGQLLPRERIARLLDLGAPWLELSSVAGYRHFAEAFVRFWIENTIPPPGMSSRR